MENTIPHNEEDITTAAFERWIKMSRPGEVFVYHIGRLSNDREDIMLVPGLGQYAHVLYEPYHTNGLTAWHAYTTGQVELTQKRLPNNRGFEYRATKRHRGAKK